MVIDVEPVVILNVTKKSFTFLEENITINYLLIKISDILASFSIG